MSTSTTAKKLDALRPILSLTETEDTWDRILKAIHALSALCNDGGCEQPDEIISFVRSISRPLVSAMNSERTRLSGPAIDLVGILAQGLGQTFEPLLPVLFPPVLTLCSRTNKVVSNRARACMATIIEASQLPSILNYLVQSASDKSASMRLAVAEGTLACLNCFNPPDLERDARAQIIENLIRSTARDSQQDVRKLGRKIFDAYKELLPSRVNSFTQPLSPTMRKYLDIKSEPRAPSPTLRANHLSSSTSALLHSHARQPAQLRHKKSASVAMPKPVVASNSTLTTSTTTTRAATAATSSAQPTKASRAVPSSVTEPQATTVAPPSGPARRVVQTTSHPARVPTKTGFEAKSLSRATGKLPARNVLPPRPASAASSGGNRPLTTADLVVDKSSRPTTTSGPRRVPLPNSDANNNELTTSRSTARTGATTKTTMPPPPPPTSMTASERRTGRSANANAKVQQVVNALQGASSQTKTLSSSRAASQTRPEQTTTSTTATLQTRPEKPATVTASAASGSQAPSEQKKASSRLMAPTASALLKTAKEPLVSKRTTETKPLAVSKPTWGKPAARQFKPKAKGPIAAPTAAKVNDVAPVQEETLVPTVEGDELVTAEAAQVPLPLSRSTTPVTVSEGEATEEVAQAVVAEEASEGVEQEAPIEEVIVEAEVAEALVEVSRTPSPMNPPTPQHKGIREFDSTATKTPITALMSSIERGFMFSPSSPLSPPLSYLSHPHVLAEDGTPMSFQPDFGGKRGNTMPPLFATGV